MNKALITGAGGFIGSHLTELLVSKGFEVKAFVHYNSANNWGWLETSKKKGEIEIISGDIRDYDAVFSAVKGSNLVFHLAALIGIPYSYLSPRAYIETNLSGTYNILQAAKILELEQVLITSTSETYGSAKYIPIDEKHPIIGQSPYSASKIAADQLAISYYRSFDIPVKLVRPFNTYGPRQSARAIIPTIISQILSGNREIKLGNLTPTRDLVFVEDTCNGFFEISKSDKLFGEITNIGMKQEISIGNLTKLIGEIIGTSIQVSIDTQRVRPEASEIDRLLCDNTKLTNFTNWQPEYNLESGLLKTVEWIRNNLDSYKSDIYNV